MLEAVEEAILSYLNPALAHPVTRIWPLVRFDEAVLTCAVYFVSVLLGTLLFKLKGVPALPVKYLQIIYDIIQVVLCGWMVQAAVWEALVVNRFDKVLCNPFNPAETNIAKVVWVFYLSKVLDFADTFFIVVTKSWTRLSFLHLYHHSTIFLIYWMVINAAYAGDVYTTVILNGLVHMLMYFYYLLTTLGYRPSWRLWVTYSQLIQFLMMNANAIYLLYNNCAYPSRVSWTYLVYIQSLFWLFFNFLRNQEGGSKKKEKRG